MARGNSLLASLLVVSFLLPASLASLADEQQFAAERLAMMHEVAQQLRASAQETGRSAIKAEVLAAMQRTPRHRFVPEDQLRYAYRNRPLPIGFGQTISQPFVVALMTDLLDVKPGQRVLEIGTGSGYQAAILAEICDSVYTIDIFKQLADRAEQTLNKLLYKNIRVKHGDGYQGWPEYAPFDAIIVTCAPSDIPRPLKEQLAEGGRMIIPVGDSGIQQLILLVRRNGKIMQESVLPVRFVPMINEKGESY